MDMDLNASKNRPNNLDSDRIVSVILPIYNGEDTLAEQIDAFRNQSYDGCWEIIAVDNRSADNSADLVQAYQRVMPQLQLVRALNKQSKGYACNVGARVARGNVLIFCDQDDVIGPGWLSALAEALETHDFVAGAIDVETLNKTAPGRPAPPNGSNKPALGFLPFVMGCNLGVSREAFEAVGGFSEDFPVADDVDISWRLHLKGYTIHDVPEAVLHYRYRQSSHELWKQLISYAESHVHLYRRFASYGMPRSSTREALQRYRWLIKKLPFLLISSKKMRERWLYKAALSWGRLRGSLRYRTVYL